MPTRNILFVLLGLLMIGGGMWFDAVNEYPLELLGDVVAASGGIVIAIGFATASRPSRLDPDKKP